MAEHISCQEVVELVTEYLEHALPSEEASLFEQHLNFCDGCLVYVEQVRMTVATAGRLHEDEIPEETRQQLLAAFQDWKRT